MDGAIARHNPTIFCTAPPLGYPMPGISNWRCGVLRGGIADPDIDVIRNRELSFACSRDFVDVFGLMVELEHLIGVGSEDLAPGSRILVGRGEKISRNGAGKRAVGFRGIVAHAADVAGFVFHLDEKNGKCCSLSDLLQVAR